MNRWSVQRRLVFVGALIIAAILAGTALTLRMQRTAAIDAYQTATTNLGNGMSQQTTQSLASVDRALLKIQRITAARLDSTDDKAETVLQSPAIFALLVDQLGRLNDVESLSLVDPQGRTLNSSSGWPAPPTDLSGQDYFNHFKSSDAPMAFVGAPVRNPGSGAWTASLSRRINDSRGRFAGLVVGEISLTELRDFYQLAMPAHRTVYLFRRDGVALVRYPDRPEEIGRKVSNQSLWYALVANGGGAYRGPADFDGTPILASVHPMRSLPFVIEASLNLSDALSEYDRQRPWVIFGCVLAIAGTVMLLRLFGRQYARIVMSELSLARKNAELDLAHQQLKITLASLSQGVSLYDENDRLVLFNERYCELLGFSSAAVRIGMSVGEILNLRAANSSLIGQHLEAVYAR